MSAPSSNTHSPFPGQRQLQTYGGKDDVIRAWLSDIMAEAITSTETLVTTGYSTSFYQDDYSSDNCYDVSQLTRNPRKRKCSEEADSMDNRHEATVTAPDSDMDISPPHHHEYPTVLQTSVRSLQAGNYPTLSQSLPTRTGTTTDITTSRSTSPTATRKRGRSPIKRLEDLSEAVPPTIFEPFDAQSSDVPVYVHEVIRVVNLTYGSPLPLSMKVRDIVSQGALDRRALRVIFSCGMQL